MASSLHFGNELKWVGAVVAEKLRTERPTAIVLGASLATVLFATATAESSKRAKEDAARFESTGATSKKEEERRKAAKAKVTVDRTFLRNFFKLLRVAMPSLRSVQGFHLFLLSALLLLRTALSLKIAAMAGLLAKRMVQAQARPFYLAVLQLALWSVPASMVNSGLKYTTALLQVAFRKNLTQHFHSRYLDQKTFFRCVGLGAVDNVDQRITQDVMYWADDAAAIYSTIFKPIVDICLFSYGVAQFGGWKAPALIIAWYGGVTVVMRSIAPPFAAMTNQQQRKEGAFRSAHTHVLTHAEEVIFSQGEGAQRAALDSLFSVALRQSNVISFLRAKHNIFEGLLVKYGSVMVGYAVCAISNFSVEAEKLSTDELTGLYLHTSRLLTDLAKAIGALILTYKTVASLAGYTHRVCELEANLTTIERLARHGGNASAGEVKVGDKIEFKDVPIISPDKAVLVKALCFYVQPGMNLLVVGPNGCGKSSTFRLLGELWPIQGGFIEKPSYEHLYYVPQRPYMSAGSLRDQLTYPARWSDLKNVSESKLYECLQDAGLGDLLDKPGVSWDAKLNWAGDALSHGEKQKLAMARLFFHQPRYAILDECSSAVDVEAEQALYQKCYDKSITLLTIAHRRSVWRYHNWVLSFDGEGGYMFSPLKFNADGDMRLTKVVFASDVEYVGREVVKTGTGRIVSTSA